MNVHMHTEPKHVIKIKRGNEPLTWDVKLCALSCPLPWRKAACPKWFLSFLPSFLQLFLLPSWKESPLVISRDIWQSLLLVPVMIFLMTDSLLFLSWTSCRCGVGIRLVGWLFFVRILWYVHVHVWQRGHFSIPLPQRISSHLISYCPIQSECADAVCVSEQWVGDWLMGILIRIWDQVSCQDCSITMGFFFGKHNGHLKQ